MDRALRSLLNIAELPDSEETRELARYTAMLVHLFKHGGGEQHPILGESGPCLVAASDLNLLSTFETEAEVQAAKDHLIAMGFPKDHPDLEAAARKFAQDLQRALAPAFEWDGHLRAWLTPTGRHHAKTYQKRLDPCMDAIRRQLRAWGAFKVALLPSSSLVPLPQRIRLALPDDAPDGHVTDELVVLPMIGAPLRNRIRKILAAIGTVDLQDLRDGVSQTLSPVPTTNQLKEILIHASSSFSIDDDDIVSFVDFIDPHEVLTTAESHALKILRDAGGVIDHELYIHQMITAGVSASSASAVLRAPFIVRHQRAVYGLRGHEPPPGELHRAATASVTRFRASLIDCTHIAVLALAILKYRLAISSVANGRLPLPSALRLPNGRWTTYFPDDTKGFLHVRNSTVRGLRPWIRRHRIGVGTSVVLVIHIKDRKIHIRLPVPEDHLGERLGTRD